MTGELVDDILLSVIEKRPRLAQLQPQHFIWILAISLAILCTIGGLLFYRNEISLRALTCWLLGLIVVGLLFILGIRISQRNSFINGFHDGRDRVAEMKKKV